MRDSWWLKVKRAQKHMVDIRREARRYAERNPYRFERIRLPDSQHEVHYRVRITEQPDPVLSLMLGDFVHNLRSALDHVIVASVPKQQQRNAGFPMFYEDIFEQDAAGDFVVKHDDARKSFERSIEGIDPRARAIVMQAQPYWHGREAHRWILGIISRLDNADKHRALATFGYGLRNIVCDVDARGETGMLAHEFTQRQFAKDNTVVGWKLPEPWRAPGFPTPAEVEMKYSATTVVHVRVTDVRANEPPTDYPINRTMREALFTVRWLLRLLEPFAVS